MGWTSYHVNGKIDRKAECRANIGADFPVIKDAMVGSTYYAAILNNNENSEHRGEIFAVVIKTSVDRNDYYNFSYKINEDNEGPVDRECPVAILNLLTPTESKWANEWRDECRVNASKKKANKMFSDLPIGAKVRLIDNRGREHILVKEPPCWQFKTWYWYDETFGGYCPKKYVTIDRCTVITEFENIAEKEMAI